MVVVHGQIYLAILDKFYNKTSYGYFSYSKDIFHNIRHNFWILVSSLFWYISSNFFVQFFSPTLHINTHKKYKYNTNKHKHKHKHNWHNFSHHHNWYNFSFMKFLHLLFLFGSYRISLVCGFCRLSNKLRVVIFVWSGTFFYTFLFFILLLLITLDLLYEFALKFLFFS